MEIQELVQSQRAFFKTGATKSIDFRINALNSLRAALLKNERDIYDALYCDLNKSAFEAYMTELGMLLDELRFVARNTRKWAKPQAVHTPLAQFHAKSFKYPEPYGVVLIMSPWNYPLQLSLAPLIGAIAAGNCAIIKPSAYSPKTSQIIADIISACFKPEYIAVIQGGRQENSDLLKLRFDYIFFTGSTAVGKSVMESASHYLTPVSLELGGKSPCIVDKSADLKTAARRIVFGKYLNAGQTCVAPDYLFVHRSIKDGLIGRLKQEIVSCYGEKPLENKDYPRIINKKHFYRLISLIQSEHILVGGETNDRLQMAPTILDNVTADSPVMQEEIFGPILPVLTYETTDEVISYIAGREKPLALYLFTNDKTFEKCVLNELSFGGGCINDTIIHLATGYMGFGGVGYSGMGSYHGKASFETFSHVKSMVKKYNWLDLPFRYMPYNATKFKFIKMFLR